MNPKELLDNWLEQLKSSSWGASGGIKQQEIDDLGRHFFERMNEAVTVGKLTPELEDKLIRISEIGVRNQLNSNKTVEFIYSLRPYLVELKNGENLVSAMKVLDLAVAYALEFYIKGREEIIRKQRQDLLDISNPVIKLWEGIVAVPLIGTLDSKRTQQVMEKLLNMIVENGAKMAILDITGVSTVDTLVANYILKTASAVKLLGANLIITGISPAIAQTMVQLGVDLGSVITRALMADGLALSLEMLGKEVITAKPAQVI